MGTEKGFFSGFDSFIRKLIRFLVIAIFAFSIVSVPICMLTYMRGYANLFSVKELVWTIPALLYCALVFFTGKLLQNKKEIYLVISMLVFEAVYFVLFLVFYDTQPCSDYDGIWRAAVEMSRGTFTDGITPGAYTYIYNWQLGIAALESVIIRIFGEHFLALKIFNAVVIAVNNFLVYKCCYVKFSKRTAVYAYTGAAMFIPWMLSVPQFTNHHIGFTLLLAAMLLLYKDKWYTYLFAGLLIGCLNVLRPMGLIVMIAAVCMAIYGMIKDHTFKAVLNNMGKLLSVVLAFAAVMSLFNVAFIKLGYTDINVSSARVPYFKFQKGLYGYDDIFKDFDKYENTEAYNEAMKAELTDTVKENPKGICAFVAKKMINFLGMFDYQFEMSFDHNDAVWSKYPIKAFYSMSWFQYLFFLVLALYAFWKTRKNREVDIFSVFFIGNTLVYLFIEAFSSYRFESYFYIIMFAAAGFDVIMQKFSKKSANKEIGDQK